MEEDNRFLRCVAEHRKVVSRDHLCDDRFSRMVAEERTQKRETRPWDLTAPVINSSIPTPPTPPTPSSRIGIESVFYLPKPATPASPAMPASPKRAIGSFEERYARSIRAATATLPTSPVVSSPKSSPKAIPRKRNDSSISHMSEENFPSLPSSLKSTPTTPTLKVLAWSDALRKNLEEGSVLEKHPRRHRQQSLHQTAGSVLDDEGEIAYDEDGFPYLR